MSNPYISVINIAKPFPASTISKCNPAFRKPTPLIALDHISCAVERGRILKLLGPNGSGKTTLLKIIASLILPDAGTVRVADLTP